MAAVHRLSAVGAVDQLLEQVGGFQIIRRPLPRHGLEVGLALLG